MTSFSDVMIRVQLQTLRREVERRFSGGTHWTGVGHPPAVDVYETSDAIVVVAELPGIAPEHLAITFHDGSLVLRGERSNPCPRDTVMPHRLEVGTGAFELRVRVPVAVEPETARARAAHGIVTVTLPKRSGEVGDGGDA